MMMHGDRRRRKCLHPAHSPYYISIIVSSIAIRNYATCSPRSRLAKWFSDWSADSCCRNRPKGCWAQWTVAGQTRLHERGERRSGAPHEELRQEVPEKLVRRHAIGPPARVRHVPTSQLSSEVSFSSFSSDASLIVFMKVILIAKPSRAGESREKRGEMSRFTSTSSLHQINCLSWSLQLISWTYSITEQVITAN